MLQIEIDKERLLLKERIQELQDRILAYEKALKRLEHKKEEPEPRL